MNLDEVLKKYREKSYSERDKGARFELLMKNFLLTYAEYRGLFSEVWLWNEFPFRKDFGGKDTGIDLVAKTLEGDFWAIQCKCYKETSTIDKPAVDSFLATSSKQFLDEDGRTTKFAQRLWVSTTNKWNREAEIAIRHQDPPVARIGLSDLENADVDWDALEEGLHGKAARNADRKPKPHQQKAIDDAHEYFKANERGKLIMACGTGKTYTSLKIAERESGEHGFVLFLVPSIALLGQTLSEWSKFSEKPLDSICICSDAAASKTMGDEIQHVDLALPATTDTKKIIERVRQARQRALHSSSEAGLTVVFSTYQSIEAISKAQKMLLAQADNEEQAAGSYLFDLIVCDEAHRTTGVTLAGKEESAFVKVHDAGFLQGKRRLYMTATPRLYTADSKRKAVEKDAVLCSMDDEELYGREIYRIGFGEAVEKHLLSDYKVIVLTIGDDQIPPALQQAIADKDQEIQTDDASKLIGCINALSKHMVEQSRLLAEVDPQPMHTAVAFCSNIKTSQRITGIFNDYKDAYYESLSEENRAKSVVIESGHVDGSMGAATRSEKLAWLKETPRDGKDCRILTNVRCLSEGVDVPSLDAVLFLSARNSQVDVVQSVGRVMRISPGKKYGYIIIPVIVPVHQSAEEVLDENKTFGVVWSVLNALRAHDDRFNATVNKIELNQNKAANGHILIGGSPDEHYGGDSPDGGKRKNGGEPETPIQTTLYFDELQGAIYARMVEKVGSKRYWEQWAQDIAKIAERHKERIQTLIAGDEKHRKAFQRFMRGLHTNINPYVKDEEAIEMLAQHLITKPVFEALFENYSFVNNNTVSQAMQRILNLLDEDGMEKDQEQLDRFYQSVKERCEGVDNAEGKQKIIIELYDKFFRTALPKIVGKLGIVYTPVEVVDFILRSVNDVLKKEFRRSLSDEQVHILDPFTGTGTFITRLLQSGIIKQKDLIRKYTRELHANEIVLLAYYIASINIENAFHDLMQGDDYTPFDGICLTDTFQLGEGDEEDALFSDVFPKNSVRVIDQKHTPIRVIVGNPPYSVGQGSANDNAQNESYPKLEQRIASTYAAFSRAKTTKALYDSYIKAFRWASDRIDPKQGGVIGFVSNAGWLDGNAMDGFRSCLEQEFSSIYVFNLRGNQRTQGEVSRREGGKIFGSGSRTPVAITILVKNPSAQKEKADIYYVDIGDYLTREEKLKKIADFQSCMSSKFPVTAMKPNEYNDWLNQRNGLFESFIPMEPDKKHNAAAQSVFTLNTLGVNSNRDAWVYNFSKSLLEGNIKHTIMAYNESLKSYKANPADLQRRNYAKYRDMNPQNISWSSSLESQFERGNEATYEPKFLEASHRPFTLQWLYWGEKLIHRRGQMDEIFPAGEDSSNLLICVSGISGTKEMSVLITDKIPDLHFNGDTQAFPLYYYEKTDTTQGNLFDQQQTQYIRRNGITDFILGQARQLYGPKTTREDIFYYVYGFLHLPSYRKEFAADLKKSLPRILLVDEPKKFWKIAKAGRELANIHLHYESQPFPEHVVVEGEASGNFRVQKLKFAKTQGQDDRSTIIYNEDIRVADIPAKAYEYVVNGRCPIEWVMDRYQIKADKDSGIENNPNKWGEEHGNPRYILDLLLRVITVSLRTLESVEGLPEVKFE